MFSKLILRNSRRSRKENGLFFGSLIISIVAFYIILSISNQDVMIFLQQMESDAVNTLLHLIPVFYGMTLVILFFLIYFACKYQLQRRRHEFGVYLMMGMDRNKLFSMLLAEDLVSSVLALLIGLPVAVLLSELISIVTAKLVGMGIIGHRFTLSLPALAFTVGGFLLIKLGAFLILSGKISRQEIGALLSDAPASAKKQKPMAVYVVAVACGVAMLVPAYTMAIRGTAWQAPDKMLLTLLLGMAGTILVFYGMRAFIGLIMKRGKRGGKLSVFNFRQIEENVIHQSTALAISSLLILAALCCFGAGVAISATNGNGDDHLLDYTFDDHRLEEPEQMFVDLQKVLEENGMENQFSALMPMRLGHARTETESSDGVYQMDEVMDALAELPQSQQRDILLNNLSYANYPHLICLSDYNALLELAGKPQLQLKPDEAAVYMDGEFAGKERTDMLNGILATHPRTELVGEPLYLTGQVQSTKLVTDRSITLSFALILPDEQFSHYTQGRYDCYVNAILDKTVAGGVSLMNAISQTNGALDSLNLEENLGITYESYLQNMGRQLFFMVSASYLTIYLAVIFLVVANTIVGVQFLMNQQKTGRRYGTLVRLGADYETLCQSARKQINWFMGLPVLVAVISSMFGVKALFAGLLPLEAQGSYKTMLLVAAAMILLLCVVEYLYMTVIKRSSDRYLLTLMEPQREE